MPLIFSTRWGIFYGWWRCWGPVTSPTMVAILDFIQEIRNRVKLIVTINNFLHLTKIMHGSIWPVTIPPGNLRNKPRGWEVFLKLSSQAYGRGGGGKSKVTPLWFCEIRVISRAVCTLQNSRLRVFKGKRKDFRFVREWLERNSLSKLKSVFEDMCVWYVL